MKVDDKYYCDDCEKEVDHNEETTEVSYGFICFGCYENLMS